MSAIADGISTWVNKVAGLTQPKNIHWCSGSEEEFQTIAKLMVLNKELIALNPKTYPNSFLYRSAANDVARTEHLTFVCTKTPEEVGPNNNWMDPQEAHAHCDNLFSGSMKNKTMYVVPYCMGPLNSPYSRFGIEITDSPYVVLNMKLMTRMGDETLCLMRQQKVSYVKGLHAVGDLSIENRIITHFPEELMIKSYGSGYGGNALLGKKCHALRIGSYQGQKEGWLAEHMLILGLESPEGKVHYISAAFPSACGKTNLAMIIPSNTYKEKGWKVWTVGDDIAWIHPGEDGRLYAINPEAGFFGVAPGTSSKTNPNALNMLNSDTIFTNVALAEDNEPWWEGKDNSIPLYDWQGRTKDEKPENEPWAHANSRFTVKASKCASYSKEAENPLGVPLSAIIFGGRRPSLIPLVYESKNWAHGVLMGASVSSQTTAAATGEVGVLRHDPMAMKPFCGTHFGSYWNHWLSFDKPGAKLPKIFHVNWFLQDENKKFLWPGFGENIRVLDWIISRCENKVDGMKTPIGFLPKTKDVNLAGLDFESSQVQKLFDIQPSGWLEEIENMEKYLEGFSDKLPGALREELSKIKKDLCS